MMSGTEFASARTVDRSWREHEWTLTLDSEPRTSTEPAAERPHGEEAALGPLVALVAGAGEHGEDSARAIEAAALELFAEHGYDGTTLRQIARHAGISPAGIYHHFPAKIDILFSLIHRSLTLMVSSTEGAVAAAGEEPAAQLEAAVRAHVAYHLDSQLEAFVGLSELRSFEGRAAGRDRLPAPPPAARLRRDRPPPRRRRAPRPLPGRGQPGDRDDGDERRQLVPARSGADPRRGAGSLRAARDRPGRGRREKGWRWLSTTSRRPTGSRSSTATGDAGARTTRPARSTT